MAATARPCNAARDQLPEPELVERVRVVVDRHGTRGAAARLSISRPAVLAVLSGTRVQQRTLVTLTLSLPEAERE